MKKIVIIIILIITINPPTADASIIYNNNLSRQEAINLIERLIDLLEKRLEELRDHNLNDREDAKDAIDDAKSEINNLKDLILDAKKSGVRTLYIEDAEDELNYAEDILNDAKNYLGRKRYSDSIDLADEAHDIARNAYEDLDDRFDTRSYGNRNKAQDELDNAWDAILDLEDLIDEAENYNIRNIYINDALDNLDDARNIFDDAENEFDDKDYNHSITSAKKSRNIAERAYDRLDSRF